MNLQQLEYLKTIANTENYTAASKILSVTQPALSKSIANLEAELQVPLFIKNGRHIKLSEYGKLFLSYAENALDEISSGIHAIDKLKESESMQISIGTTSNIGINFLPSIISGFITAYPKVDFHFNYQPGDLLMQNLKDNMFDFCFYDSTYSEELEEELSSFPICDIQNILLVPKCHRLAKETEVSLQDLQEESFVSSCKLTQEQQNAFESFLGYSPKIVMQANESNMVEGLVAAGIGIAIVPDTPLMNTNIFSKVKLKDATCSRSIYMVWNESFTFSKASKAFLEYIKTTFPSNL